MSRIGKLGDRVKVIEKEPGKESWYGTVADLYGFGGPGRVIVRHGNTVCVFYESSLRNVTQAPLPKEEDNRTVGEVIAANRKKPKRKVRRIR